MTCMNLLRAFCLCLEFCSLSISKSYTPYTENFVVVVAGHWHGPRQSSSEYLGLHSCLAPCFLCTSASYPLDVHGLFSGAILPFHLGKVDQGTAGRPNSLACTQVFPPYSSCCGQTGSSLKVSLFVFSLAGVQVYLFHRPCGILHVTVCIALHAKSTCATERKVKESRVTTKRLSEYENRAFLGLHSSYIVLLWSPTGLCWFLFQIVPCVHCRGDGGSRTCQT